jgi:2,5-dihydroxypyridine 5,6-dioxygenase
MAGTLDHLRRPLVQNIDAAKKVLVLSDFDCDPRVWQAVMTSLTDIGTDARLSFFERRPADYHDLPSSARGLWSGTDRGQFCVRVEGDIK